MATSNASISGLASGLDTASIISQLMQLEAVPQSRLKTQITTQQTAMKALQDLNAKVAALATKAADLAKASGWAPMKATSSYDKVTVTTTSGASAGSLSFTVLATAKAHTLSSVNSAASLTTSVVTDPSKNVTLDMLDGTTYTINTGDGSLQGLVDGINAAAKGVQASAIKLNDGTYRLRLESTTTGAASNFALTQANGNQKVLGGFTTTTTGADAQIKVGADTLNSSTNTFSNILPGVNVTLGVDAVANTTVVATMATDGKTMTDTLKGLVDALNAVLTDIDSDTQTASASGTKAGVMPGDSRLRDVRDRLIGTLYSSSGSALADVGIQLDRYGKFTFDATKFQSAYEANPTATAAKFTAATTNTGFADRLATVAKQASDSIDGSITLAIKGSQSTIDDLQNRVDDWDRRLELRQSTLQAQFTALETALNQMNSQSSWLSGQIASLPTSS